MLRIADMVSTAFGNGGYTFLRVSMSCVVSANSWRCNGSFSRRDNACGKHSCISIRLSMWFINWLSRYRKIAYRLRVTDVSTPCRAAELPQKTARLKSHLKIWLPHPLIWSSFVARTNSSVCLNCSKMSIEAKKKSWLPRTGIEPVILSFRVDLLVIRFTTEPTGLAYR